MLFSQKCKYKYFYRKSLPYRTELISAAIVAISLFPYLIRAWTKFISNCITFETIKTSLFIFHIV